ncbi:hypothetical protein [Kyrpidia tusciae]|uniref:Uncharacterized protein n=1 Tax=Kyrpidia tusciae (strain DSM 2912 / NBRC 15312 / T2) TaxID=562970 RepID=D5WVN7_KYRT2|nr:hypothetical protein [Kyrpidia tusciae]ADG07580.1 conserved hypothetical protein [Kyrpidia tusciae DSM 2912]
MTVLTEGTLQLKLPHGVEGRKFDGDAHGLSHCMKAVDFVVELPDRIIFIEFKDPDHPFSKPKDRQKFIQNFMSGDLDVDLVYKYRDSFLYLWAWKDVKKPVHYLVLIAMRSLTAAELLIRTDELKRKLPLNGPESGMWQRPIVNECGVFNIETWNKQLPDYPVTRIIREGSGSLAGDTRKQSDGKPG